MRAHIAATAQFYRKLFEAIARCLSGIFNRISFEDSASNSGDCAADKSPGLKD